MNVKILQLHKRSSYHFKNIQDKFAFEEEKGCFALADGTTQSFNSEKWAEIITKDFIKNPQFTTKNIIELFTKSVEEYRSSKFEFSKNPATASLEKVKMQHGGTATFIGLQFIENNQIQLISCGDTNFFKISKDKNEYFPYNNLDDLDKNNHFINTQKLAEQKIDETYFQTKIIPYNNGDRIILATDALSRLFLRNSKIISEFISINNFDKLHQFCLKYWGNKQLEEDDISAIVINIENKNIVQIIQPSKDFSFPKEKEEVFVPAPLPPINNPMEMQEIRQNFNGIARDFKEVKNQLSLQRMLILLISGILVINIFFIYLTRQKKDDRIQKELSEKTDRINTLESKLSSKNAEIIGLKSENQKFNNSLNKKTEGIKKLEADLGELRTKFKNLKSENKNLKNKSQKLESENKKLKKRLPEEEVEGKSTDIIIEKENND